MLQELYHQCKLKETKGGRDRDPGSAMVTTRTQSQGHLFFLGKITGNLSGRSDVICTCCSSFWGLVASRYIQPLQAPGNSMT